MKPRFIINPVGVGIEFNFLHPVNEAARDMLIGDDRVILVDRRSGVVVNPEIIPDGLKPRYRVIVGGYGDISFKFMRTNGVNSGYIEYIYCDGHWMVWDYKKGCFYPYSLHPFVAHGSGHGDDACEDFGYAIDEEFNRCYECDGHDACEDFGCAIESGLGHLVHRSLY